MTTNPPPLDLLKRAENYLSALHGSVARHDNLAANLGCAGCELRDQIRGALAAAARPTGQTALRDRIAEALYAHDHPGHLVPLNETGMQPAYRESADAVLAVLSPPADRAAVLCEAADKLTAGCPDHGPNGGWLMTCQCEGAAELRRMAAEAQQQPDTETRRVWCKCPSCWGWFVEEHPGEDLDELGRDLGWWSGLPEHRDPPAGVTTSAGVADENPDRARENPRAVCVCGHTRGEHIAVSGRLLCDSCDPDSTENLVCREFDAL